MSAIRAHQRRVFATLLAGEFLLALLGIGLAYLFLGNAFPFRLWLDVPALFWGTVTALPPMLLVWAVWQDGGRRLPALWQRLNDILERLAPALATLLVEMRLGGIVLLSLAAGVGEEVLFRGVLQPLIGLLAASLIFGALHAFTLGYFLMASAFGLYLGWLYEASGNLAVPILAHAVYDVFALVLLRRVYRRRGASARWQEGEPR